MIIIILWYSYGYSILTLITTFIFTYCLTSLVYIRCRCGNSNCNNDDTFFHFQELLDSKQRGRERLNRVQRFGAVARDHTGSGGYEAMEREEAALISSWEQWERGALQTRASLETTLLQITNSEQEFNRQSTQLEQDLQALSQQLQDYHGRLSQAESKHSGEEAVKGWQIAKVSHVFQYLLL